MRSFTTPPRLNRTLLSTTRKSTLSLKLPILLPLDRWKLKKKAFWEEETVDAVLVTPTSKKFNTSLDLFLGKDTIQPLSLPFVIGELVVALPPTVTPRTTFPGTRTNTSLNTAVHAGLRDLPLPLPIDSTFTTIRAT
jgi:hypothetical protein